MNVPRAVPRPGVPDLALVRERRGASRRFLHGKRQIVKSVASAIPLSYSSNDAKHDNLEPIRKPRRRMATPGRHEVFG